MDGGLDLRKGANRVSKHLFTGTHWPLPWNSRQNEESRKKREDKSLKNSD